MTSGLLIALVLGAYDGPGRGAAPEASTGVFVIVGIAVGVLAIAAGTAWWLTHRNR